MGTFPLVAPQSPARARVGPRVEVWTDLAAAGGQRLDFVPAGDVITLTSTDVLDLSGTCTLAVRLASRAVPLLTGRRVLRLVETDVARAAVNPTVEWRITQPTSDTGAMLHTVTAVQPLLDLATAGELRDVNALPAVSYSVGGVYTAIELVDLIVAWMASQGRGYFSRGAITGPGVASARPVTASHVTALALLRQVQTVWGVEVTCDRVGDAGYALGLRPAVGSDAPVLRVRGGVFGRGTAPGGALTGLKVKADTSSFATALVPSCGAGSGATVAPLASTSTSSTTTASSAATPTAASDAASPAPLGRGLWQVAALTAVAGGTAVALVDPASPGDPLAGPIACDGQLVGAALVGPNGARRAINASLGATVAATGSVTLTDASSLAVGDLVRFAGTVAGAPLFALTHPTGLATYGRVESPYARTDLSDTANLIPNPLGTRDAASGGRFAWQRLAGGGMLPTEDAVSLPAGCPIDAIEGGQGRRFTCTAAGQGVRFAPALAVDPAELGGDDAVVSWYVVLFLGTVGGQALQQQFADATGRGTDPRVRLVVDDGGVGALPPTTAGVAGAVPNLLLQRTWTCGDYVVLGLENVRLAALARLTLTLVAEDGSVTHSAAGSWGAAGTYPIAVGDATSRTGGGIRAIVCGVQLTRTAGSRAHVDGSGANALHQATNALLLAQGGAPPVLIEAGLLDVAQLNPAAYGDQPVVLGGSVLATYGLGAGRAPLIGAGRITSRTRNHLVASGTTCALGPPPATLSARSAAQASAAVRAATAAALGQPAPAVVDQLEVEWSPNPDGPWFPTDDPAIDLYRHERVGPNAPWSGAIRIAGRDGTPGANALAVVYANDSATAGYLTRAGNTFTRSATGGEGWNYVGLRTADSYAAGAAASGGFGAPGVAFGLTQDIAVGSIERIDFAWARVPDSTQYVAAYAAGSIIYSTVRAYDPAERYTVHVVADPLGGDGTVYYLVNGAPVESRPASAGAYYGRAAWGSHGGALVDFGFAPGAPAGVDGASVEVQWSTDGSGVGAGAWHAAYAAGDQYLRQRTGTGAWDAAARVVGEDGDPGADGTYLDTRFVRAATQPATPTGEAPGTYDAPPTGTDPLWMTAARRQAGTATLLSAWSPYVRLTGDAGASVQVQWSTDGTGVGPGAWHDAYASGDLYLRQRTGTGAWSAAVRAVGEDGDPGEHTAYRFVRAAAQPATPTADGSAGSDAPPAGSDPLWMTSARIAGDGSHLTAWSAYARLTGERGADGASAPGAAFVTTAAAPDYNAGVLAGGHQLAMEWAGATVTVKAQQLLPSLGAVVDLSTAGNPFQYVPEYELRQTGTGRASVRVTFTASLPGGATATGRPVTCVYNRAGPGDPT